MTLQQAETFLARCIQIGYFEEGTFADFTEVEKIVFAQHTSERIALGMFAKSEEGIEA